MFSVWRPLTKFTKFIKILNATLKIKSCVFQNEPVNNNLIEIKKHSLIFGFLCGIGSKNKNAEINLAEEVLHNVALATIALKDGNVEKSGIMLLKTLDLAEKSKYTVGVISVCELLSTLAVKLGDYIKAESLICKALDNLRGQGVPEDDNYVISFNLKLSRIYSSQGNDDLAEQNFEKCKQMQKNKLKTNVDEETFLLWSSILYWYGKFLLAKHRFTEAKSCFEDCFSASLKVKEFLPNQIMVILYNLGEVCEVLGELDEAMEHLLKGVSLDKKCKNPDLTFFYSKLGEISYSKGLYKEAKDWCNQAQKFALKYQNLEALRESNECLQKLNAFFVT